MFQPSGVMEQSNIQECLTLQKKNIVFVLNEYNGHGGAQRVASILANDFVADGHNVKILSINEQQNQPSYFNDEIEVNVIHDDGYRAPMEKALFPHLKSFKFKVVSKELKRRRQLIKSRLKVEKFFDQFGDEMVYVIVIQVWGMQWLENLMYRDNIKIIGQSHESFAAAYNSHRFKRILKYYKQTAKFLLLTEKDAAKFENLGFTNVGVLHNPTTYRKQQNAKKLWENKTFISVGRLIEDKGNDLLIEAFNKVKNQLPGWKLEIYGDGPDYKSLKLLIDIYNLQDRVFLKGRTENALEVYEQASILLLGSKAEGLPMTLIEAQSCSLPCISTDCAPGIKEIINEYETGLLATVGDADQFSRHMVRLAKDFNRYEAYSKNAYIESQKFERNYIKQQWYELFDEVGVEHE